MNKEQQKEEIQQLINDRNEAWFKVEELQEDLDCVHMWLDDYNIAKTDSSGENTFSIVGRVQLLIEQAREETRQWCINELNEWKSTKNDIESKKYNRVIDDAITVIHLSGKQDKDKGEGE